jgi:hypothetical protein
MVEVKSDTPLWDGDPFICWNSYRHFLVVVRLTNV